MKSKIYAISFFLLLDTFILYAQEGEKKDTISKALWERSISIRKAFEDKNDKDKPAIFSMTWPNDKDNSYLINGGISLSFSRLKNKQKKNGRNGGKFEFDFFTVYNRNNQIKKEQNNIKAGLTMDFKFGRSNKEKNERSYFKIFPSIQYMSNKVDTTKSFIGLAYFTWILKTKHFLLNGYKTIHKSGLHYFLGPVFGFEYQNRFDVKKPLLKGAVGRYYFGGDARLAFKVRVIDTTTKKRGKASEGLKIAELIFSYTGRKDFMNTSNTPEGHIYLFKSEFAFYPFKNDSLAFGLSYNKGEDPIAAVEKQEFWQFAVKLKLDYKVK